MLDWHSWVVVLVVSAVITQIAVFSTTIYLHRTATHKAIEELHPALEWTFRLLLWLTTGIRTKEWVAVHRKHHAHTDQEGDPHSPKLLGFWSVQLWNVVHYKKETKNLETLERYAKDIDEGWWDLVFFNHGTDGVVFGTFLLFAFLGPAGLLAAGIHLVVYVFVLSSSINGLCHSVGYKNFENTATNIPILGLLAGGEGLHNNHHGHPRSPKFSFKASEFDPAWPIIKGFEILGLAKLYKTMN